MQDNFKPLGADSSAVNLQPADRMKRLMAHIIDGLAVVAPMLLALPFIFGGAALAKDNDPPILMFLAMAVAGLVVLGIAFYQLYLLATTGQTIGKRAQNIRIVCVDGSKADWIKTILLRSFVTSVASQFTGGIVGLLDPFFIFREDNRCIHDHIAGTIVVDA